MNLELQTPMGSVFSPSETLLKSNLSDYSHEKLKPLDHLNNLLTSRDVSGTKLVNGQKREHTRKARQALSVVLGEIAPNEADSLWQALISSSKANVMMKV